MKALALISEKNNSNAAQWQFDKIMAAIAYDFELSIVFLFDGVAQLQKNQAWKSLEIYGIENIYKLSDNHPNTLKSTINYIEVNDEQLNQLIQQSDIIL